MRLPPLTADASARSAKSAFGNEARSVGAIRILPMADIGCLTRCVGQTAYQCLRCGTDLGCWASCAGPGAVSCISRCYGSGA
jgi:hypothetical protein